jgi:hypothetical protein
MVICPKFDDIILSVKFSAEMDIHRIGPWPEPDEVVDEVVDWLSNWKKLPRRSPRSRLTGDEVSTVNVMSLMPWRRGAVDIASASGTRRPMFESRQGIRFLMKHSSAVLYKMT